MMSKINQTDIDRLIELVGGRSNTATVLRVINDKGENGWLEIPIDQ
ncbi:hypothetical protein QU862_28350, partial [Escherichia coli]|nr:hypothetical protein [Escherichia coli]